MKSMNGLEWQIIVLGIIVTIVIAFISYVLIKEAKLAKFQKRFDRFSLAPINEKETSLIDKTITIIWNAIQKFSKTLGKINFFKKQSQKYEKFISFEEKDSKNKMDYIALKLLIAMLLLLICCISLIAHNPSLKLIRCFIAILIGYYLPDLFLNIKFLQKRKQIEDDLLKAIIIMNNSFKSGRNIMQAVEIVKNELTGPISDEFKKIYMDITYGLSMEVVFNRFYERVKLEDAKYITSSISLLNKTGGNIIKVFSSIEKSFFDKKKLQNEMKSLTSASVFVFRILVILPILFTFGVYIMNPSYFAPFFETPFGFLTLLFIIILYILYIVTIKKVLRVKI